MIFLTFFLPLLVVLLSGLRAHGYIPAQPSNSTVQVTSQADIPRLHLQWYPNGSDWEHMIIRRSATSNASGDAAQGLFVHFSEDITGTETTTTPWIAFISCDANSTNSSQGADIFTMAKKRGAKSAVLYSLYSETCMINPSYRVPTLDIFSTSSLNTSRRIEYEFGQFGSRNKAYYGYFNATMLNNAAKVINDTIALGSPATPGFLFSTLPVYNTSDGMQTDSNETESSTGTSGGDSQDTGVAMIVLYAITGCVSALFCGVIVSGAIRAIRHPERYGPRRADPTTGGGQSRAGGLGRAILDTFPIVKFGSTGNNRESSPLHSKDIESARLDTESNTPAFPHDSIQLAQLSPAAGYDDHSHDPQVGPVSTIGQEMGQDNQAPERTDQVDTPLQRDRESSRVPISPHEIVPECIGRETCPICIVDFEEGDDLRVLPCEGKHQFHQSCVDPWLLELSASCPLCRQDFRALETIICGGPGNEAPSANRNSDSGASLQHNRRFSRYLRFALRRQRRSSTGEDGSLPPES